MPRSLSREAFSMTFLDTPQIILVGRDGNGKTSTKRSIENVSQEIQVVEFSGVGDTGPDRVDDTKSVWNNLRLIIENCDKRGGLKAIVLVMKYGVRFTKQEKDAVEDVKAMLGKDVFRKHGIILMSYGDLFTNDNADNTNENFMSWCRQQTGDIKNIFEEVDHRIVLFNNRTNNFDEKKAQVEKFMSLVARVDGSYCLEEFIEAPNSIHFDTSPKPKKDFISLTVHVILTIILSLLLVYCIYNNITWLMVVSAMVIFYFIFVFYGQKPWLRIRLRHSHATDHLMKRAPL